MATEISLSSNTDVVTISRKSIWTGRIISAIPVLFLIFDAFIKFTNIAPVIDAFQRLGIPVSLAKVIGTLELICLVLYLIPRTSIFGAILFTGFLGGAVAIHVRVGDPLFSHVLFPIYVGLLLWIGLYLRNERLRELITGN
jgi:hypothetical protein